MMGGLELPATGEPFADADVTAAEADGAASRGRQPARTARSSRTTQRQIAYWRRIGLLRPGVSELAQARMIASLRRAGVSVARIRAAGERLAASWADDDENSPPFEPFATGSPLPDTQESSTRRARFTMLAGELFIRHPDGSWEGDSQPGQLIIDGILPLPAAAEFSSEVSSEMPRSAALGNAAAENGARSAHTSGRRLRPAPDREAILRFVQRENARTPPVPEIPPA